MNELIDKYYENKQEYRPVSRITGSRYHACDRHLWLKRRNAKKPKFEGRMLRLFEFGHQMEPIFCEWLEAIGVKVYMREAEVESGFIDGVVKVDDEFQLLEMKTLNNTKFNAVKKHGLLKAADYYHYQVQIYMHDSSTLSKTGKRLEKCLLMAMNKNTHELYFETIEYNEFYAVEFKNRIIASDHDDLPAQNVDDYVCKMCDYKEICAGNEIVFNACGTCANFSVENGCEYGKEPCERHVFHPAIMSLMGYEYNDVHHDAGCIEYEKFINGPKKTGFSKPVLTSEEIYKLGNDMDENILDIVNRFDAIVIGNHPNK